MTNPTPEGGTTKVEPPALTTKQVCELLSISRSTLDRMVDRGDLPFAQAREGGARRFRREDIDALFRPQAHPTEQEA